MKSIMFGACRIREVIYPPENPVGEWPIWWPSGGGLGGPISPDPSGGGSSGGGSYTDTNHIFEDGPTLEWKPTEYNQKCAGIQGLWERSFDNNRTKEAIGFLTNDGNFVVCPTFRNATIDCNNPNGYTSSNRPGGWAIKHGGKGRVFLSYNNSDNSGVKVVQVIASFHTHPCGSNTAPSDADVQFAGNYSEINHYVVDTGGIGQYSVDSSAGGALVPYYRFTSDAPDLPRLCNKYPNQFN